MSPEETKSLGSVIPNELDDLVGRKRAGKSWRKRERGQVVRSLRDRSIELARRLRRGASLEGFLFSKLPAQRFPMNHAIAPVLFSLSRALRL